MNQERISKDKLKEILEQNPLADLEPCDILNLAAAKYLQKVEYWQKSLVGGGGIDQPTKEAIIEIEQENALEVQQLADSLRPSNPTQVKRLEKAKNKFVPE